MTTTIKKAFTAVVAMVMALVLMVPAGAAYAAGTGSITITPPTGTASDTTNTYKIYKVFNADGNGTNISYKLPNGKIIDGSAMATYFDVDSAGNVTAKDVAKDAEGNLTSDAIAAIATFVQGDEAVATVTSTGTAIATATGLDNGYYYITTSTGTAVTITSTNPNAEVKDKNTVPSVDKKITGATYLDQNGKDALAELGSTVSYKSDITVPANSKKLVFNDTMGSGLTLNADSITVKVDGTDVEAANYTKTVDGNTIKIEFADSYISELGNNTKIVVTYSATVNSDALTIDTGKNTASLNYGDNKATTSSETQVYNAKITVDKSFQGLAEGASLNNDSAEFVLKNADGKYYQNNGSVVSWVDSINDATKLTYAKHDSQSFTGLANGNYTLVESKTPAGYKTAENKTITINGGDYTDSNLQQKADIVNETGSALPSTGGMGTTVLYAVGAALVITAGALLIARKRNTQE